MPDSSLAMLGNIPLFANLPEKERENIMSCTIRRKYPKNTIIVSEGDENNSLYVIVGGRVKVYLTNAEGSEVTLRFQVSGEYFGELALLDKQPRSASVVTVEPTELLVLTKADIERRMMENPQLAIDIIQFLTARIRTLTDEVRALALLDVYGRVSKTLLGLAIEKDDELVVSQKLTHQDIASMVGASREMVTRILKELTLGGYLTIDRGAITIHKKLPSGW